MATVNKREVTRMTEDGRKLALLTQAYFRSVEELRASSAKDEAVRIGAGESVFRWLIMPRLVELQNLAGSVRLEFLTKNDDAVCRIGEGRTSGSGNRSQRGSR